MKTTYAFHNARTYNDETVLYGVYRIILADGTRLGDVGREVMLAIVKRHPDAKVLRIGRTISRNTTHEMWEGGEITENVTEKDAVRRVNPANWHDIHNHHVSRPSAGQLLNSLNDSLTW